jgi:hypothetical protein
VPQFLKEQKQTEAIRCYSFIYSKLQDIQNTSLDKMHVVLADLHTFGFRMRQILASSDAEFSRSPRTQKLLGYKIFETSGGPEVKIHVLSALNRSFNPTLKSRAGDQFPVLRTQDGDYITTIEHIGEAGKMLLTNSFLSVIYAHHNACKDATAFRSLCDGFSVNRCTNGSECRWLHVSAEDMRMHFNARFRIFLHQVLVIHDMDSVLNWRQKKEIRK